MTSSHAMAGPQWKDFGWRSHRTDEYGETDPSYARFFHAEGPEGFGVESPTGRDYGAVIGHRKEDKAFDLRHVQEYGGISEAADKVNDAVEFMGITGANEATFDTPLEIDSTDLVKNLYSKRPNFPKTFKTKGRAQHVAELLIKRRDANIPLTPRPNQGK